MERDIESLRGLPILGDDGGPESHPLVEYYDNLMKRTATAPAVGTTPAEKLTKGTTQAKLPEQVPPLSLQPSSVTLCNPAILPSLNQNEVDFVTNPKNAETYKAFHFGQPIGSLYGGTSFNDAPDLLNAVGADEWPTRLEIAATSENLVHRIKLIYSKFTSSHTAQHVPYKAGSVGNVRETIPANAKIIKISFADRLTYIAVELSNGRKYACGFRPTDPEALTVCTLPEGCKGLKGFWGRDGLTLERLGPIWG